MSSDNTPALSVPLPKRGSAVLNTAPPVWSLEESGEAPLPPLQAKCARHDRPGEVCCKELKGDDERILIDPDVVRDVLALLYRLKFEKNIPDFTIQCYRSI